MFLAMSAFSFAEGEDYSDYKALLIGDENGNIIKEDNANSVRPLASITKVMTSILTFDKLKNGQNSKALMRIVYMMQIYRNIT